MTQTLEAAPAGTNAIKFQMEQAVQATAEVPTWTPALLPHERPKPAAAMKLRQRAADMDEEALAVRNRALAVEEEAVALEHAILTAEGEVKQLAQRITALERHDFLKQAERAKISIRNGIEHCDAADPTRSFDRLALQVLRAPEFARLHAEALKETKLKLAAAKKHLAELTKSE